MILGNGLYHKKWPKIITFKKMEQQWENSLPETMRMSFWSNTSIWVTVFKNGPIKIRGSTPNHFKLFKGCLTQILLGLFLNTLTYMELHDRVVLYVICILYVSYFLDGVGKAQHIYPFYSCWWPVCWLVYWNSFPIWKVLIFFISSLQLTS